LTDDSAKLKPSNEAYILLNGFFSISPFVKLYENSKGLSWGRQFQVVTAVPEGRPPGQSKKPSSPKIAKASN
jgi:hypothetical protein